MSDNTSSLVDIAARMAELADTRSGDPEADHAEGDRLLVETIKWLTADESAVVEGMVLQLLADYERIKKWYA